MRRRIERRKDKVEEMDGWKNESMKEKEGKKGQRLNKKKKRIKYKVSQSRDN